MIQHVKNEVVNVFFFFSKFLNNCFSHLNKDRPFDFLIVVRPDYDSISLPSCGCMLQTVHTFKNYDIERKTKELHVFSSMQQYYTIYSNSSSRIKSNRIESTDMN